MDSIYISCIPFAHTNIFTIIHLRTKTLLVAIAVYNEYSDEAKGYEEQPCNKLIPAQCTHPFGVLTKEANALFHLAFCSGYFWGMRHWVRVHIVIENTGQNVADGSASSCTYE